MKGKYVPLRPGEKVLIDIGGFGIEAKLSADATYYTVRYVKIDYQMDATALSGKRAVPSLLPADVVVDDGHRKTSIPQAHSVKIFRHKKRG